MCILPIGKLGGGPRVLAELSSPIGESKQTLRQSLADSG